MNSPRFALNLPDPRLRAGVSWDDWPMWNTGADPLHPGWYGNPYDWTDAQLLGSLGVSADTAMRVSVVNRCISLRANTVGSLYCNLVQQVGDRKERARTHPAQRAVRRKPNAWQTRFNFFRDMQAKHDLHGIALAKIEDVGGGAARTIALNPLDPQRAVVEQTSRGEYRVTYRQKDGTKKTYLQEELLILRDLSLDFYTGMARSALAREAIAVSTAAEQFVRRFFVNDAGGRLVLKHPGRFQSEEARKDAFQAIRAEVMGSLNAHKPFLAWGGLEVQELAKAKDTDFIVEPRTFQATDIARFWGCPGILIGLEDKTSSWGTGVWEIKQAFVDFTIKPETINWAESLEMALLTERERENDYTFEFVFGSFLQANPLDQANVFKTYKEIGVYSADEIRTKLNENPRADGGGGTYQENAPGAPPNRGAGGATPAALVAPRVPRAIVADAARRVARATRHGGKEKWMEAAAQIVAPIADAYDLGAGFVGEVQSAVAALVGTDADHEAAILATLEHLTAPIEKAA